MPQMSNVPPLPEYVPPTTVSYAVRDPRTVDLEHLKVLAICSYVWAGLLGFFACFGVIYIVMGIAFASSGFGPTGPGRTAPSPQEAKLFGLIFVLFGVVLFLGGWALAICTIIAGRSLARRRRRLFATIVAAINCALFPFGTVLGVFTLVVIMRQSVRQLFEEEKHLSQSFNQSSSGSSTLT